MKDNLSKQLTENGIGDVGFVMISKALKINTTLMELRMKGEYKQQFGKTMKTIMCSKQCK